MSSNEPRDQDAAAPNHPVGWYRTMEPDWATKHFGFPVDPATGDEWTASDGSVWVYRLTGTQWWEMSTYPPGPEPTPGDEMATMLARKLAQAWEFERHETVRPYQLMPVAGRLMHDTDLLDALAGFAGWRPPPRVIETPEAIALEPTGTVIRSRQGDIGSVDHGGNGEWTDGSTVIHMLDFATSDGRLYVGELDANLASTFPWTVLHEPEETGR